MKLNLNYIKDFFEPKFIRYEIRLPINVVVQKLNEALYFVNSDDLTGTINNNEFAMNFLSVDVPGENLVATLRGTISESNSGITFMDIYIIRNSGAYLTFFFSIIAAIIYFIIYINDFKSTSFLFWGIGMLIGGSVFSIWFSNLSSNTLKKKFEIFLEKNGLKYPKLPLTQLAKKVG